MKRILIFALLLALAVAAVVYAAAVDTVNVESKALNPRAEAKFGDETTPGRRTWGEIVVRQEGAYRVVIIGPAGEVEVATVACAPAAEKKVVLRVMVDAVEVDEKPAPKEEDPK